MGRRPPGAMAAARLADASNHLNPPNAKPFGRVPHCIAGNSTDVDHATVSQAQCCTATVHLRSYSPRDPSQTGAHMERTGPMLVATFVSLGFVATARGQLAKPQQTPPGAE